MVNIYLRDSGLLQVPYLASETSFGEYGSTSVIQKRAGEYRVNDSVLLKVTGFQMDISENSQTSSSSEDRRTQLQKGNIQPITFTLTAFLNKPKNKFTGTDVEDLNNLGELLRMKMSKGYKQLWIYGGTLDPVGREQLFSLYQFLETFGIEDGSLSYGTTVGSEERHLKVSFDGITQNEGVENLTYQLQFTLLWDFN